MKDLNDLVKYGHYRGKAVDASGIALNTYNDFGFTQIVECVSEEMCNTIVWHSGKMKKVKRERHI